MDGTRTVLIWLKLKEKLVKKNMRYTILTDSDILRQGDEYCVMIVSYMMKGSMWNNVAPVFIGEDVKKYLDYLEDVSGKKGRKIRRPIYKRKIG